MHCPTCGKLLGSNEYCRKCYELRYKFALRKDYFTTGQKLGIKTAQRIKIQVVHKEANEYVIMRGIKDVKAFTANCYIDLCNSNVKNPRRMDCDEVSILLTLGKYWGSAYIPYDVFVSHVQLMKFKKNEKLYFLSKPPFIMFAYQCIIDSLKEVSRFFIPQYGL